MKALSIIFVVVLCKVSKNAEICLPSDNTSFLGFDLERDDIVFKKITMNKVRSERFDWREMNHVSPIRDQKRCAACWAFSTVSAVESVISIKHGKMLDLSEQMLIDCNPNYFGCAGGYPPFAMEFIRTFGISTEEEYQYKGVEGKQCLMSSNKTKIFIDGYTLLDKNEETIADWIFSNGPVSFLMSFTRSMYAYKSGIFHPSPKECLNQSTGSYGMTIVGYGVSLNSKYWIVKNSWGVNWGEDGYMRLARGFNVCGMANSVVAPIVK